MRSPPCLHVAVCLLVTTMTACFDDVDPVIVTTGPQTPSSSDTSHEPNPGPTTTSTSVATWVPTTLETTSIGFGEVTSEGDDTGDLHDTDAHPLPGEDGDTGTTMAWGEVDSGSSSHETTLSNVEGSSTWAAGGSESGAEESGAETLDGESSSTGPVSSEESTGGEDTTGDSGSEGNNRCRTDEDCGLLSRCCPCGGPPGWPGVCLPLCLVC